jgi:putrescine importer
MDQKNKGITKLNEGTLQQKVGFWELIFFGLIFMSPSSSLIYYPITQSWSGGYSYISYSVATIFILLTVLSYSKMVMVFSGTGSAYTYVSKGINAKVGFIVGCALLHSYILLPMFISALFGLYAGELMPIIPPWGWSILAAIFVTASACYGIKTSVMVQIAIGIFMILTCLLFGGASFIYIIKHNLLLFNSKVIYDPEMFTLSGTIQAASLGILSFVGFDGIVTLSEESKVGKGKIAKALIIAVIVDSILLIGLSYIAAATMDWSNIPKKNFDTAFLYLLRVVVQPKFASVIIGIGQVTSLAIIIAAVTACSRIMFAMGKDKVLPEKFFGHISHRFNTPTYNLIFIGTTAIIGALTVSWKLLAELVSFGFIISFVGVNAGIIVFFYHKKREKRIFRHLLFPLIAILGMFWVISTLSKLCLIEGGIWLTICIIYFVYKYKNSIKFRDSINKGIEEL